MIPETTAVEESYAARLAAFLAQPSEGNLAAAYQLGRSSLQDGVGIVEILMAHRLALQSQLDDGPAADLSLRATSFLAECLAPLEMAYGGYLSTNRELRELNAELHAANADLVEANSDLDRLAYLAAHDLSEPLLRIAGPLGLLAKRYHGQLDDSADTFIGFAVEGCKRMRQMLDDLVVYTELANGESRIEPTDCNIAVVRALGELDATIRQTNAIVSVDRLPVVAAEPTQLALAFRKLIDNALKFVAPGVTPEIAIGADREGDLWRLTVTDNGIGIEPQYRERIFGVSKRLHTHEEYPGSGIGLALVKKIVGHYGGRVGTDGTPSGTGSRFWFTLRATQ